MFLVVFHHLQEEEEVRGEVMVLLDEDDMSSKIFGCPEMLEDPVEFPPPVVFSLGVLSLSVVAVYVWPARVGAVTARVPEQQRETSHCVL